MTLLSHLVASDWRRFRWLIVAWITLVASGVVVYAISPGVAGNDRLFGALQVTAGLLWVVRQLLRVVLVAAIVHTHPAVGSTAFWMTRPIAPRLLLASKAVLIFGVTVGAPVAGHVALAIACHVPLRETLLAAFQTALAHGVWVALIMTVAVLTRSLTQFVVVCGAAISGAALVPTVAELLSTFRPTMHPGLSNVAFVPRMLVIAAIVFIAGLAVAWLVQYARRTRGETIAVSAGGLCLALAIGFAPPPSFLVSRVQPPAWAQGAALQLQPFSLPYLETLSVSWTPGTQSTYAVVRAMLVVPALPRGWFADVVLRDATVGTVRTAMASDGLASRHGAVLSRTAAGNIHPIQIAVHEALEVDRLFGSYYGADAALLFAAPDADLDRLASVRGPYRGRFQVTFTRVEAMAALPLTPGATFQDGAYRVTIRDVRLDGALTLRVERSDAATIVSGRAKPEYQFYLRNRNAREALAGAVRSARDFPIVSGMGMLLDLATVTTGVWTSAEFLTYRGGRSMTQPGLIVQEGWDLTPEWVNGAELVVVRLTRSGTVERPLEIDAFKLDPTRR